MSQWSGLVSGLRYIFSGQIERKRSEEYLVINLAVERKLWAIFLLQGVHLWKRQTPAGRLKVQQNKLKLKLQDSGFLETL